MVLPFPSKLGVTMWLTLANENRAKVTHVLESQCIIYDIPFCCFEQLVMLQMVEAPSVWDPEWEDTKSSQANLMGFVNKCKCLLWISKIWGVWGPVVYFALYWLKYPSFLWIYTSYRISSNVWPTQVEWKGFLCVPTNLKYTSLSL